MTAKQLQRTTFSTSRLLDFARRRSSRRRPATRSASGRWSSSRSSSTTRSTPARRPASRRRSRSRSTTPGSSIRDNGPGLPAATVKGILDFSSGSSSREAYVSPTRGAQGNALKTIVAMPFVLDGERGAVEIAAQGERHRIEFAVDHIRQEPVIDHRGRAGRL